MSGASTVRLVHWFLVRSGLSLIMYGTVKTLLPCSFTFVPRAQLTTLNKNAVCWRSNSVKRSKFGEVMLL